MAERRSRTRGKEKRKTTWAVHGVAERGATYPFRGRLKAVRRGRSKPVRTAGMDM